MHLILSPAKRFRLAPTTLDDATPVASLPACTSPQWDSKTSTILSGLQKLSVQQFAKQYDLSEKISQQSVAYHASFSTNTPHHALLAFDGDVYRAMKPEQFPRHLLEQAFRQVGIISGFYGFLRAGDGIRPYRFDMDNNKTIARHKNPYAFWKEDVISALAAWAANPANASSPIINLASQSYSLALEPYLKKYQLQDRFVTVRFLQQRGDALANIGLLAKQARGAIVRPLLENPITSIEQLADFAFGDYRPAPQLAALKGGRQIPRTMTFVRPMPT
ncbi:MAG: YaaA family protein [Alphaproteobacteria bacterium]|nr:YaaA family protein [Alphaproteobacteria bacterium]